MSWHYLQEGEEVSWEDNSSDGAPSALLRLLPKPEACCWQGSETASLSLSRFGMTLPPLTESLGGGMSMSSVAVSPARTSVVQIQQARDLKGNALASGGTWPGSLAKLDPNTLLWKTAQCSLFEDSEECFETWPRWGMMHDGECWGLTPPADLAYCESEFGSWPSVTKSMSNDYKFKVESMLKVGFGATQHRLTYQMLTLHGLWPTATLAERLMMWPEQWTELKSLETGKYQVWLEKHGRYCLDT